MSNTHNPCGNCELDSCQKALDQYNDLLRKNQKDPLFYTLEFLLFKAKNNNGAIGENNATTQNKIVRYLNKQLGSSMSVEAWQQSILQGLKDEGIVVTKIYSGQSPGTFIPCKRNELKKPIQDLIKRIKRETDHLEDYSKLI